MFNFGGFDFGDMPGRGPAARQKNVDNKKFYDLLGLSKDASDAQIKKAFRTQAMEHHPDKGGDPEKFKELQKAYEVLSDKEKREIYDQYGEEAALQGGSGSSGGPTDIFDLFGMRGGGGRSSNGPRKGQDTVFPLRVDLEDLYNGTTKKLKLTKKVVCKTCSGKGSKSGQTQTCAACKGRGVRVVIRQLGPGMIQQMQTHCNDCDGTGESINEKDRCKDCKGEKTVPLEKILEVPVQRGTRHGEKLKFRGEGDELPGIEPGDVICVVQQKEHPVFKRDGPNLILHKKITLLEALAGFTFHIKQLDGRWLTVHSEKGQIYKPGDIKAVPNEGMPKARNQFERGMLFIELDVEFPKNGQLSDKDRQLLSKLLPPPEKTAMDIDLTAEPEVVQMVDVDMKAEIEKHKQHAEEEASGEAYHEDEDGPRGPGAQCRAQ